MRWRPPRWRWPRSAFGSGWRAGAVWFCAIYALVFATSGFTRTHTARYWIPLVPGLAVLAAVACAAPARRAVRAAAWILLASLALWQGAAATSALAASNRKAIATLEGYREIGAALKRAGADALLAPIQLFPLNFALDERFAVSNGRQKFYEPILRRAELSDAPAYSSDFNGIGPFLVQQGAAFDTIPAAGRSIVWNVRRPPAALREIPAGEIAALRDGAGTDWKPTLCDRNLDTVWSPGPRADATLEWTFVRPQDVEALQLTFAHSMGEDAFDFPRRIRVEANLDGEWKTLLEDEPIIPLEWSGPRLYYPAGLARPEFHVEAHGARALRVALAGAPAQGGDSAWRLAEIAALASDGNRIQRDAAAAVEALAEWLRQQAPEAVVYAPRWISNQLLAGRKVPEERLAGLAARIFSDGDIPRDGSVAADRACVFVVEPRYEEAARNALAANGAEFRFAAVDSWRVFAVEAVGLGLPPAMKWTGEALLLGNASARVAEALRRLRAGKESEDAQKALLAEIVRWRPSALSALTEEETLRLGGEEAVRARRESAQFPAKPCATEFANGLRLEGVEVAPMAVRLGGPIDVRLYWSADEDFEPGQEIVFIHLRDGQGKIVAQDDYRGSALLWGDASLRPVPGECIAETRRIALPPDTPYGSLDLAVGLYQPKNGRRVKVCRTEAPAVRRRAPIWPAAVQIVP